MFGLIICTLGVLVVLFVYKRWHRCKNYPPGPLNFPILGNIPQLFWLAYRSGDTRFFGLQDKLAKRYGDVMSIHVFQLHVVVISDATLARSAYSGHGFVNRPQQSYMTMFGEGLATSEGEMWRVHRQFFLRLMRDMRVGTTDLEEIVRAACDDMLTVFHNSDAKPIDTHEGVYGFISHVAGRLVFGQPIDTNRNAFKQYLHAIEDILTGFSIVGLLPSLFTFMDYPWVVKLLPVSSKMNDAWQSMKDYCRAEIEAHKQRTLENTETPRCYLEALLNEQKTLREEHEDRLQFFNDNVIVDVCNSIFFGGVDTSANSIRWMIMCLALYPHVQTRARAEVIRLFGRDTLPPFSRRSDADYCEAVAAEVLRRVTILPYGVEHRAGNGVRLSGYDIPANAVVVANLYTVLHDERYWTAPMEFNPDRFLDADGKFAQPKHWMPFSVGRHVCAGEVLARAELFVVMVGLLQRFEIAFDGEVSNEERQALLEIEDQPITIPPKYRAVFKPLVT